MGKAIFCFHLAGNLLSLICKINLSHIVTGQSGNCLHKFFGPLPEERNQIDYLCIVLYCTGESSLPKIYRLLKSELT